MKFEKINKEQYFKDGLNEFIHYEDIKLPVRATLRSAGNDIYSVCDFTLSPGETVKLPTGIKVLLDADKFLMVVPRSGLGFKFRTMLWNTVGVIDADYSDSDNDGHIWIKIINESDKVLYIKQGDALCQGIIMQYFKTEDDDVTDVRNGGFGSTSS